MADCRHVGAFPAGSIAGKVQNPDPSIAGLTAEVDIALCVDCESLVVKSVQLWRGTHLALSTTQRIPLHKPTGGECGA